MLWLSLGHSRALSTSAALVSEFLMTLCLGHASLGYKMFYQDPWVMGSIPGLLNLDFYKAYNFVWCIMYNVCMVWSFRDPEATLFVWMK